MRAFFSAVFLGLLPYFSASAQSLSPPERPEIPISFSSTVTDVCFPVAYQNTISPQTHLILNLLPEKPTALNGMYPLIPTWYRLKKEPQNIYIGVGDKPNLCHVVLTDSKDGRQSFNALVTLLKSAGFTGGWDARGSALMIMGKKWGSSNLILILKGLTDSTDGVGPQVSVDVGSASDDKVKALFGETKR